ncbi:MAG: DJ-1/PfpI family protein, partial [Pseudomonadota bacterium]|nr:DJ-1/PfpI family protein [Pseudomonadota bacterium]
APYIVLACHGLLEGKSATAYPGFREDLTTVGVMPSDEVVVIDGNTITSQGPGSAMQFALALVTKLCGEEVSHQVADGLLV